MKGISVSFLTKILGLMAQKREVGNREREGARETERGCRRQIKMEERGKMGKERRESAKRKEKQKEKM